MNGDENTNIRRTVEAMDLVSPPRNFWQIVAMMFGVGPAKLYEPIRGGGIGGHRALHGGALAHQAMEAAPGGGVGPMIWLPVFSLGLTLLLAKMWGKPPR